jgi:hypothetical protein
MCIDLMILTIPTGVCVCVCVCSSSSSFYGLLEGVALSTGMFEVFLYFFLNHIKCTCVYYFHSLLQILARRRVDDRWCDDQWRVDDV